MSKSKKAAKASADDLDDVRFSQTQTLTQAQKAVQNLSKEDENRKVSELMMYLLIADQRKQPIKRIDINKNVLKEHAKAFNHFMAEAEKRLKQVFGISLVEIDSKQKSYILFSDIEHDSEHPHVEWPPDDNAKTGLIMVILSLIFMNGNVMTDEVLYRSLRKLGVDVELTHEQFGDAKKLITQEFVRQGYLEYTRQPNIDPPIYEFTWGPRAKHETSKRMVLNFVCQIYGDNMEPHKWTSQWQDVLRSEENGDEETV